MYGLTSKVTLLSPQSPIFDFLSSFSHRFYLIKPPQYICPTSAESDLQPKKQIKKKKRSQPAGDSDERSLQTYSQSTDAASPRTDTSEATLFSQSPPPKKKKKIVAEQSRAEQRHPHRLRNGMILLESICTIGLSSENLSIT